MKKKGLILICGILCLTTLAQGKYLSANNNGDVLPQAVGSTLPEGTVFKRYTEDGKIIIEDTEKLEAETVKEMASKNKLLRSRNVGGAREIKYGVVNFKTKPNSSYNTSYTDTATGKTGYTNGYYQADGAFLGYENGKVKFMLSGVIGLVNSSEVDIVEYDDAQSVNYYVSKNGNFYHNSTANIYKTAYSSSLIGKQPSYIKTGTPYYSYDAHYFYTSYSKMISDYKAGTRKNAVNAKSPYYNYYQYISLRSKTSLTGSDLNTYLKAYLNEAGISYTASNSKMYELGNSFISTQNKYGANALTMFGVAINESNFGRSSIAENKNNLFGINAVDSDPNQADGYATPADSITDFAKWYVNRWYSTPQYASTTYHGAFLGDKASGMNVSYASDPNWGETAASWMWWIDNYLGKSDVGKYKVGFKDSGSINIRKEASTASASLYSTPANQNMTFVILGTVSGENVSGSNKWYKIQLDTPLNSSRTAVDYSNSGYNFSKSYGYVHSSLLSETIFTGNEGSDNGTSYMKGDVNGNSKIDAADYLMIKDNILGKYTFNDKQKKAADVNGNKKIDAADYLMIKDYILGKIKF